MQLILIGKAPRRRVEVVVDDSLLEHFCLILLHEGKGPLFTHFNFQLSEKTKLQQPIFAGVQD